MVYVWCICGTCLKDVWWELTEIHWRMSSGFLVDVIFVRKHMNKQLPPGTPPHTSYSGTLTVGVVSNP